MFSRFCKNSIFPSSSLNNNPSNESSNVTQQRSLPNPPSNNNLNREPPPSYWASHHRSSAATGTVSNHSRRRPAPPPPPLIIHPLFDTDSDDSERERRFRIIQPPPPRRPKNEQILLDEDLFCPDLVRNCKSLPVIEDDQDYIEIEELTSRLSLHNEIGLPINETSNMGQTVSLRRPKISLTWVLREQQNQTNKQQPQQKKQPSLDWNSEKILFRRNSKPKEKLFSEKYVSENNLTDFRGKKIEKDEKKSQENISSTQIEVKRKTKERCCGHRHSPDYDRLKPTSTTDNSSSGGGLKKRSLSQANLSTYSDPSIYITSAQSDTGALMKRRRRKKRSHRIGYNIKNVDEFLSKCSLSNPANIPVVLSNASILYQTRTGYNQIEVPIPLGMIVNSIFKNQNWLYVQTPHGEEGYVNYNACMPLGIIPNQTRSSPPNKPPKPWESNNDVFPSVNGNYTDSEKEMQIRGCGTRSEGRQTPKLRKSNRTCSEKHLDSLYLRAASQPKIIDHAYAQLKPTEKCKSTNFNNFDKINGDYVQLKYNEEKFNFNSNPKRQVLLAITENYSSDMIQVKEGEVVSLLACKEYQDMGKIRQWFFIRCRDGSEGYIPHHITDEFL